MSDTSTVTDARSRSLRGVLTLLLATLLVASVAWLVVALAGDDEKNLQSDRDAVVQAARAYVDAASNYGPSDLDEQKLLTAYRERVRPLISTSYQDEFEKSVENLGPLVVQGFGVSTAVDRAGVASLTDDRAVVLVSGETARSLQSKSEAPLGFTLEVELVRVGDNWLVSSAPTDVTADDGANTSEAPAPSETESPTDEPSQPAGKKSDKKGAKQ